MLLKQPPLSIGQVIGVVFMFFWYNRTKDGGIIWDGRHAFTSNHVHFYPCLFAYRKLGAIKKLFSKK